MARKVGKVYFPVSDTFRLNGVKVVRVTWPIDQPVYDDTPLRAYGPRGYVGVVQSQQHAKLQNKLHFFGYLRPRPAPSTPAVELTDVELWEELYEKCFTPDGMHDRSDAHADARIRSEENADTTLVHEGVKRDHRGYWANNPVHPSHNRWCEIAHLTLTYISDTEGLEL